MNKIYYIGNQTNYKVLSHILFAYGKYLTIHPNIDLKRAYFYFKLAAHIGGLPEA